jgi:hypothetical protein
LPEPFIDVKTFGGIPEYLISPLPFNLAEREAVAYTSVLPEPLRKMVTVLVSSFLAPKCP